MNEFVNYLNGLHNYNAQNKNSYGERNVESPFYARTMVEMDVCGYIINAIEEKEPHIIILTGHAGDGKTSIMYQVLRRIGINTGFMQPINEAVTDSGKTIYCIKDFSELSDENKLKTLLQVVKYPTEGKYVFMVANTGPLINTFGRMYDDELISEKARMELIDAMDSNDGSIKEILGNKLSVINIAAIENTGFSKNYLEKVLDDSLWDVCKACPKCQYCHINTNRNLIDENRDRVLEFITNYYIWQTEYGTRLTIRSMTEHLAYMITGGDTCEDIHPGSSHEKLFSNLFFGYEGIISNPLAENILAVRHAKESGIYLRRLRVDEELLIRRNYRTLFGEKINQIISEIDDSIMMRKEFDDELRRMYLFLNIMPDDQHKRDTEDIFSKQFDGFVSVRNKKAKPTKAQKDLVIDALRMIYLGTVIRNNNMIPITMGTEAGITQSVQLIAGELNSGELELLAKDDSALNAKQRNLVLRIKKSKEFILTLPMLDHFEELKNGVIATNMDPQLSHGLENLKSILLWLSDTDDDKFDFLVMDNRGFSEKSIVIEEGRISIQ